MPQIGRLRLASVCGGPSWIPRQLKLDLCRKKWHWGRVFSGYFCFLCYLLFHDNSIFHPSCGLCILVSLSVYLPRDSASPESKNIQMNLEGRQLWSGFFRLKIVSRHFLHLDYIVRILCSSMIDERERIGTKSSRTNRANIIESTWKDWGKPRKHHSE
jgi:hypothetical protein